MKFWALLIAASVLSLCSARNLLTKARITCNKVAIPDLRIDFYEDDVWNDDLLGSDFTNVNGTARTINEEWDGWFNGPMEPIIQVQKFQCPEGQETTCQWFHIDKDTIDTMLPSGDRQVEFNLDFPSACDGH